jgi:hypothetical protein
MIEVEFYKGYITIKMLITLHEGHTYTSFRQIINDILELTEATVIDDWGSAVTFTLPGSKFIYNFNETDYGILIQNNYVETEAMTESRYLDFMTRVKDFGLCDTGYLI